MALTDTVTKAEPQSPTSSFRASLASFSYAASSPNRIRRSPRNHAFKPSASTPAPTTPPRSPNKRRIDALKEEEESESPKKKRKGSPVKRGYADPTKYAHLRPLHDYLAMGLDVMFCGINPGVMSAETGHHFASPTNHFWRALHQGGLVPNFVPASEDYTLPEKYNLGMTNLVDRPSAEAAELSAKEMVESAPAFLQKVTTWRPRIICFVGKGIWLAVQKNLDTRTAAVLPTGGQKTVVEAPEDVKDAVEEDMPDSASRSTATAPSPSTPKGVQKKKPAKRKDVFDYGLQPYVLLLPPEVSQLPNSSEVVTKIDVDFDASQSIALVKEEETSTLITPIRTGIDETLIWVMPSTSGRVVSHQLVDKIKLFAKLKQEADAAKAGTLDTSRYRKIQL
ncbi:DNA glycosylase [Calocera cornea HHB12733]|uniref:DNA glycosylase n=1 Tax=Calocera cornea HHB12733 TaxID=1353952 RepID=A0A165CGS9_9BASI|nr:DNA glycosylase [Calocera cornea HHB12733]KZT50764.1 DNA glycosylase [Calocera cornea HHB12733]